MRDTCDTGGVAACCLAAAFKCSKGIRLWSSQSSRTAVCCTPTRNCKCLQQNCNATRIALPCAGGGDDDEMAWTTGVTAPVVALRPGSARLMPAVGMGTSSQTPVPHETTKDAVLAAIEAGFRHLDTASMYGTERPVGEAVAEAARRGLVASREEVFVTSKLWCTQCHPDLVLPALRQTLQNLQMEYVDLYLIHSPMCMKPGPPSFPGKKEDVVPLDIKGVWRAMEECQRLGLARAIGVSNFTTKHLDKLLAAAEITPAVNQVELNPVWQQRTLRGYCAEKGIHVAAYSPLGGQNWDGTGNAVMASDVLAGIAKARGKTVAQVALRWIYEQGVTSIVKSYNKDRLKQNLEIFDWELTDEDRKEISKIPQKKIVNASVLFSQEGEFTSVDPADLDIVEEQGSTAKYAPLLQWRAP